MKFKKDDLREIVCGEYTLEDDSVTDVVHEEESAGKHDCTYTEVVFRHTTIDGPKYYEFGYETSYNEGIQDYYWADEEDLVEVEPHEVTTIEYRAVA